MTVRLGFGDDKECEGSLEVKWSPVRRNAKGRRCDLEWVSMWVGVVDDLKWDLECLFAMAS